MAVAPGPFSGLTHPRHPGWPARLGPLLAGRCEVMLRPLSRADGADWREQRLRDERLIARWDATSELSWEQRHTPPMWRSHRGLLASASRRGEVLPFAITVDARFHGQVTLGGIQRGALNSAWVGYWVDSAVTGRGVATAALALTVAHGFGQVGLHRVEATVSPENRASMKVLEHLGFRREGHLQRYLDIAGAWRDHLLFALTVEEVPDGLADLLHRWSAHREGATGPQT